MTGARSGQPDDRSVSGRDLWTLDGTNALIRKLQSDPGLTDEFRKEAIDSVKSGAVDRGLLPPEHAAKPKKVEIVVTEVKPVKVETPVISKTTDSKAFDDYQDFTTSTALYPPEVALPYTTTGIAGEAAEVAGKVQAIVAKSLIAAEGLAGDEAIKNLHQLNDLLKTAAKHGEELEKFKKAVRKGEKKLPAMRQISEEERLEIAKEIGDVLWYCAQISRSIGLPLSKVAAMNVEKLSSRKARGTLHGNGDNR